VGRVEENRWSSLDSLQAARPFGRRDTARDGADVEGVGEALDGPDGEGEIVQLVLT
jgi:hypothetical protein